MAAGRAGRGRARTALAVHRRRKVMYGPAMARMVTQWSFPGDLPRSKQIAAVLLRFMDDHLSTRSFLAADHPTIADLACYSYVAHAPEGGIPLGELCVGACLAAPRRSIAAFQAHPAVADTAANVSAMDGSPFNPDELAAQALAGGGPRGRRHPGFHAGAAPAFLRSTALSLRRCNRCRRLAAGDSAHGEAGLRSVPGSCDICTSPPCRMPGSRSEGARRPIARSAFSASISRHAGATAPTAASRAASPRHHCRRQPELRQLSAIHPAADPRIRSSS